MRMNTKFQSKTQARESIKPPCLSQPWLCQRRRTRCVQTRLVWRARCALTCRRRLAMLQTTAETAYDISRHPQPPSTTCYRVSPATWDQCYLPPNKGKHAPLRLQPGRLIVDLSTKRYAGSDWPKSSLPDTFQQTNVYIISCHFLTNCSAAKMHLVQQCFYKSSNSIVEESAFAKVIKKYYTNSLFYTKLSTRSRQCGMCDKQLTDQ